MRRPVMYLAGLLLATGASFAFAGTASAAVSHDSHATIAGDYPYDWFDEDGDEFDGRVSGDFDFDSRINQDVDSNSNPDIRIVNDNRSGAASSSASLLDQILGVVAGGGAGGAGGAGGEGGTGQDFGLF